MDALDTTLREDFGLPSFRPWQREAIEALLDGPRRVLVVAPTGGGKSLCYQLPAARLGGTSVVVSPLIALMEDQVHALTERGIAATFLASTLDGAELRERMSRLRAGEYRLVYVAPERLAVGGTLDLLRGLSPPLVAIDEAHCISQWGHDFRPDYLRLSRVLEALRPAHVLACTATATPVVRDEIVERLGLGADAAVVLRGFARPNLHLAAAEIDGKGALRAAMVGALRESLPKPDEGAAIVYTATRRQSEAATEDLRAAGFDAACYHAGLSAERRAEVSHAFASRELRVVAATNAFGMGIDRPDIRCVVHLAAPGSIEAYYQEVGRAGRDGQPAHGLLLSSTGDLGLRRRLIEGDGLGARSQERVSQQWQMFLDLMRYVEAGSCRHDFILRYFGDEQELLGGCGHCDVCERLGDADPTEDAVDAAAALVVRKAISGVARARGSVGLKRISEMLAGKDNAGIRRMGLDRLSTFGILSDRDPAWVLALLRRLLTAGLVDISADRYPVASITSAGVRVMKGEQPVRVLPPPEGRGRRGGGRSRKSRRDPPVELSPEQAARFEALRAARLELARERGVPAYVVCHDRTLADIARHAPATRVELGAIRGMGPARVDAYGDAFLAVLRAER